MLSRIKAIKKNSSHNRNKNVALTLESFIEKRDYIGASTFLNFSVLSEVDLLLWKAYCSFHNKDFEASQEIYIDLLSGNYDDPVPEETTLYLACVYYYLEMYSEATEAANDGPDCSLKNRIMYHVSNRLQQDNTEVNLKYKQRLGNSEEDRLSLAAALFEQCNYQQVCETYKRMMIDNRNNLALNLYIAMCYFKMDYYDISLETLQVYEQTHGDCIVAKNLRAANMFLLYNGKAALDVLKDNIKDCKENNLLRHNMVVFTDGQRALQVLPSMIDVVPEAKLNLAIYHLRNDEIQIAVELLQDLDPTSPQEYILKGVASAMAMDAEFSEEARKEYVENAKAYFQSVGTSPSETDTIPGRQCMAQFHFLQKQFDEVNVYLGSIQSYMSDDDIFNWNYGQSLTATEAYETAEEVLLNINSHDYKKEICYIASLCRASIYNCNADKAWYIYSNTKTIDEQNQEYLLKLIGNDCYRFRSFIVAAKAFDKLHEFDSDMYTDPMVCACVGALQDVDFGQKMQRFNSFQTNETIDEIISILAKHTNNERAANFLKMIQGWTNEK